MSVAECYLRPMHTFFRMHAPAPDAEPGPHDPARVVPSAPVPPEMEPLVPERQPEKPLRPSRDVPGEPEPGTV